MELYKGMRLDDIIPISIIRELNYTCSINFFFNFFKEKREGKREPNDLSQGDNSSRYSKAHMPYRTQTGHDSAALHWAPRQPKAGQHRKGTHHKRRHPNRETVMGVEAGEKH